MRTVAAVPPGDQQMTIVEVDPHARVMSRDEVLALPGHIVADGAFRLLVGRTSRTAGVRRASPRVSFTVPSGRDRQVVGEAVSGRSGRAVRVAQGQVRRVERPDVNLGHRQPRRHDSPRPLKAYDGQGGSA